MSESDDEDWFERALREDEERPDEPDGDRPASDDRGSDDPPSEDSASGEESATSPAEGSDRAAESEDEGEGESGSESASPFGGDGTESPFGRSGSSGSSGESDADDRTPDAGEGTAGGDEGEDADPFAEDFAEALENAPDPGGAFGDVGGEDVGFGSSAGGSGGPDGQVGPGGAGVGGGPAGEDGDDPFGFGGPGAGGAGGGGDFGFGGPGGGEDFDEAEFESDIERIDLGIEGLDEMILGGVPRRSLITAIGSAGTGKTTFSLQFLREALERDRNVVFVSLEESRERVLDSADEKGWDFSGHAEDGRLAIVDLDPIEMATSLNSIQNELPALIEDFGAERLVLDSVSLLEMMYDHPSTRRTEVFEFTTALKEIGVTTFVTSEASEESPYASRYGIIEYLADAVFVLQYIRPSDFRETRLAVEIQKIRDANHSRETKPYEITGDGISVYRQANIF